MNDASGLIAQLRSAPSCRSRSNEARCGRSKRRGHSRCAAVIGVANESFTPARSRDAAAGFAGWPRDRRGLAAIEHVARLNEAAAQQTERLEIGRGLFSGDQIALGCQRVPGQRLGREITHVENGGDQLRVPVGGTQVIREMVPQVWLGGWQVGPARVRGPMRIEEIAL